MDDAVATIEAAAPPRGAASPIKPVHELYGEILLDLARPDEAIDKFETSLLRMPRGPVHPGSCSRDIEKHRSRP